MSIVAYKEVKMKNQNSNFLKLLAAVVIGAIFILAIGIAVSGWQKDSNGENSGEDGNTTGNADNQNGDTDSIEGGTADNIQPQDKPKEPEFINYLTGLGCDQSAVSNIPFMFVSDPNSSTYGISDAELVIEVPVEKGDTRLAIFRSNVSGLGKIGSLVSTRDYITALSKFFGGLTVAYGDDDIISYDSVPATLHLDLSKRLEAVYKENGKNIYTDSELLHEYVNDEKLDTQTLKNQVLPYTLCEFGKKIVGKTSATSVILPYSETNTSALIYNDENGKYLFSKNSEQKIDMLSGNEVEFTNVFILFADSITYELSCGTETVTDTAGGGTGYYISGGTLTEIRWSIDQYGNMIFKDLDSNKLTVNRGNSYIAFYKASESTKVVFN